VSRCDQLAAPVFSTARSVADASPYVEGQLAPALRKGDIVVMDNLGSRKCEAVRSAI
jgi:hypothetical protein